MRIEIKAASGLKPGGRFFVSLLTAILLFTQMAAAVANPTATIGDEIALKQLELEKVKTELQAMETELEIIGEAYHGAVWELEQTQAKLAENRLEFEKSKEDFDFQSQVLNNRLKTIYVLGEVHFFEVILNATSFKDFLVRVQFLLRIGEKDNELLQKIRAERDKLEILKEGLEELGEKQKVIKDQLESKKMERELKVAEVQNYLSSISEDIRLLLEQEKLLKEQEKQNVKEETRRILNLLDIYIEPGSVVETALQYLGIPYVWAGDSPEEGFDCSGLMLYVYAQHGITLPHYSGAQFKLGEPVTSKSDLMPGDLVFFGHPIHHVGMYVGKDYFLHAPQSGDFVRLGRLSERIDYAGARRFNPPLIYEVIRSTPSATYPQNESFMTTAPVILPPKNPIIEFPSEEQNL